MFRPEKKTPDDLLNAVRQNRRREREAQALAEYEAMVKAHPRYPELWAPAWLKWVDARRQNPQKP